MVIMVAVVIDIAADAIPDIAGMLAVVTDIAGIVAAIIDIMATVALTDTVVTEAIVIESLS